MQIVINMDKKHFFIVLAVILMMGGAITVWAYGTANPSQFGHTMNETLGLDTNHNGIVDDCEIEVSGGGFISVSEWINNDASGAGGFFDSGSCTGGFIPGDSFCNYYYSAC